MKNKKIFILAIGSLLVITAIISLVIILSINKLGVAENNDDAFAYLPRYDMEYSFLTDVSMPENAMDYYPYAFIAKVNKKVKTEYRNPTEMEITADGSETKTTYEPYTIYDISVVENLKGEIIKNKNIFIEQVGGVSKDNDYVLFPKGMDFLKEDSYYILLPYSPSDTDELRLESSYNVIELGTLSDKKIKNKVFEIAKQEDFPTIDKLYKEKDSQEVINKLLTYKHASMTPTDMEKYKKKAEENGIKDSEKFYFANNVSKYDVNYKK